MPIFEYRCRRCGREFERLVRGAENASCPGCGSADTEKRFSTFGMKSSGTFTSSRGKGCGGCSSGNCATCR